MERGIGDEAGVAVIFDKREEREEVKKGLKMKMSRTKTMKSRGAGQVLKLQSQHSIDG